MSQPEEPTTGAEQGGADRADGIGEAEGHAEPQGAPPPTESEPTPSAAAPPPGGHYVWVPAGARPPGRRFGPAVGRFARHRATQLVAAVVVGAVIGGGTVAIVDNAAHRDVPNRTFFHGPFGNGNGGNGPGFRFRGGQGSGI